MQKLSYAGDYSSLSLGFAEDEIGMLTNSEIRQINKILFTGDNKTKESYKQKPVSVVYFIQECGRGLIKIGHSSNLKERLKSIRQAVPHNIIVLGVLAGTRETEKEIQYKFSDLRVKGEWFFPDGTLKDYIKTNRTENLMNNL